MGFLSTWFQLLVLLVNIDKSTQCYGHKLSLVFTFKTSFFNSNNLVFPKDEVPTFAQSFYKFFIEAFLQETCTSSLFLELRVYRLLKLTFSK